MADGKDDRSLGELFSELAQETSTLVRQEMHLAAREMSSRASKAGKDIGVAVAGGVILHTCFLVVVATIIIVLAEIGLDWWLAALIVAAVLGAVGYLLVRRAISSIKRAEILPHRTIEHLKENQEWVKEQVG
jgi:hypothetical protein